MTPTILATKVLQFVQGVAELHTYVAYLQARSAQLEEIESGPTGGEPGDEAVGGGGGTGDVGDHEPRWLFVAHKPGCVGRIGWPSGDSFEESVRSWHAQADGHVMVVRSIDGQFRPGSTFAQSAASLIAEMDVGSATTQDATTADTEPRWEPDMDHIHDAFWAARREHGDNETKCAAAFANIVAAQARAHYEPQLERLRAELENLRWVKDMDQLSVSVMRDHRDEARAELRAAKERIAELESSLAKAQVKIDSMSAAQKDERESRRTALVHKRYHEQVVGDLEEKLQEAKQRIAELESRESEHDAKLELQWQAAQAVANERDGLEEKLQASKQRIAELESQRAKLDARIGALGDYAAELGQPERSSKDPLEFIKSRMVYALRRAEELAESADAMESQRANVQPVLSDDEIVEIHKSFGFVASSDDTKRRWCLGARAVLAAGMPKGAVRFQVNCEASEVTEVALLESDSGVMRELDPDTRGTLHCTFIPEAE